MKKKMIRIKRVNENLGGEVCKVLNYQETQDIYDKNPKFELDFTDEENKIIDEQYKKIISHFISNFMMIGIGFDIVSKEGECHEIDPSYEVAYKVTSKYYFTKQEPDIVAVKLPDDYYFVHVFTEYVDINLLCDDIDGLEDISKTVIKEINKKYER